MTLDEYCQKQNVMGISNVDTRALTKVLRETGCLVGVISTDESKSNDELLAMAKNWTIVGKDLLSVVSCTEPYEWKDPTDDEWEFNNATKEQEKQFLVSKEPSIAAA
jgi:carbamoyl-phosphate synthase small subunit